MPGNIGPEHGCPYTIWEGPGVYDFPDWMQMLLNSIYHLKGSVDTLNETLGGVDDRGLKVDLGTFGDIASIMGDPNDPDDYNANPLRPLQWADFIHEFRAMRGIYRDKDDGILFFKRRHRMDPGEPLQDLSEQGPAFNPLDPSTWGYLFFGNKHPAWSPYHPAYASVERMQGYQKGFFGHPDPQAPMSLGELDEAGWKSLYDDYDTAKKWVAALFDLLSLIDLNWNIDLPDLTWLLEVAKAGGSVADAVRQMQIREESFLAAERKRGYFQLLIAQNESIIEELRKLQGIPAYQKDLDPGKLTHENAVVGMLQALGVWESLPQWVKDSFPYTGDALNPNYGDYVALDGSLPSEANLQTWTDADGNQHRTVKDPKWAKFRHDQFDTMRANLLTLRGSRPKMVNGALNYHERATLQDLLDALSFAPRNKDPAKPVPRGTPYNPHPSSDGSSLPTLDPDEILDLATLPDQANTALDWWNTLTGTIDGAGDVGEILVELGTGGIDQVTDIGIIASTGGTAVMSFLNFCMLLNIATHVSGNPLRPDWGYMSISPDKPVRQTLENISRSLYGDALTEGTTPPNQEDQMLTQLRNRVDEVEQHIDQVEAKLDSLLAFFTGEEPAP